MSSFELVEGPQDGAKISVGDPAPACVWSSPVPSSSEIARWSPRCRGDLTVQYKRDGNVYRLVKLETAGQ